MGNANLNLAHLVLESSQQGVRVMQRNIIWDYFAQATTPKKGLLRDFSKTGCLICSDERIEPDRWLRVLIAEKNIWFTLVGRITYSQNKLESCDGYRFTLFQQGLQFMQPPNELLITSMKSFPISNLDDFRIRPIIKDEVS